MNNAIKHAKAQHITLSISSNETSICVLIKDDGVGFDLSRNRAGIGLTNIYNRAESYNGTVEIRTAPGMGCKLKAVLPSVEIGFILLVKSLSNLWLSLWVGKR